MAIGSENSRPATLGSETVPAVALMPNNNTDVNPNIERMYLVIFFIFILFKFFFLSFGVRQSPEDSSAFLMF